MAEALKLPVIDLQSEDVVFTVESIRQACTECGFFYVINHGVDKDLLGRLFYQSKKFFSLPLEVKMKLERKEHRGYSALYAEKLDSSLSNPAGDSKESFYIGPFQDGKSHLNQWPSEGTLPAWRETMEAYYNLVLLVGKRLMSLIALALDLDQSFFEEIGAMKSPNGFLRLLHYPGELELTSGEVFGASAHTDYGMITLLATDGVPGLQVCRDKDIQPRLWEEVPHIDGAFVVNLGDMLERWTNCKFRSTLHRVMPVGQERYSAAFFLDPNEDCVVECIESCCTKSCPPKNMDGMRCWKETKENEAEMVPPNPQWRLSSTTFQGYLWLNTNSVSERNPITTSVFQAVADPERKLIGALKQGGGKNFFKTLN